MDKCDGKHPLERRKVNWQPSFAVMNVEVNVVANEHGEDVHIAWEMRSKGGSDLSLAWTAAEQRLASVLQRESSLRSNVPEAAATCTGVWYCRSRALRSASNRSRSSTQSCTRKKSEIGGGESEGE